MNAETLHTVISQNSTWLVTSRLDATHARRVERDERVKPCLFQHGGRRRSSSARVYKFSLLCSQFASISGTTSWKIEVDMLIPVHAVATRLNTCRASRACRAYRNERVAPCCPTSATRLVTTFPYARMHGLGSVSCLGVTW